ncbi:3-oxoacyl-[acyl-carrier protein] reductase paralog [hydrothermal vent metagenome]|uniref:3-oxoacyl-[acyl-carrier protein] reductase paralog n=1 Tax=hydrothermal vent metagenome TaxID=652676 RepID=A0A3B1AQ67_9ZZZZ
MKKAIIIGASSGIGKELSRVLSDRGVTVGIAARRLQVLEELRDELPNAAVVKEIDVTKPESAMSALSELINEMGGVDLVVFSSGIGDINKQLSWQLESECIATNVIGFTAIANVAIKHFLDEKSGHFVGISSVAALRGGKEAPAYNASKAFVSNYMEGLRQKITESKYPITITDIKPGFVDTKMAKGEGLFWVASADKAAEQIYQAIMKKKSYTYVTKRWRLVGWLLKALPETIYNRL